MSRIDTVGSHKTNVFTQNNVTSVVYDNTAVVQFSPTKIVLDSGGYETKTTKLRMNQTSNQYGLGFEVYQQNYKWFVKYRGKTLEFYDGMELERLLNCYFFTVCKTVKDFEIINHGIEWSDYFQGCGVFCTEYGHVTTGIGYSAKEALDDALEIMAQSHSNIDFDDLEKRIVEEYGEIPEEITVKPEDYLPEGFDPEEYDGELPWHHISIRYNL